MLRGTVRPQDRRDLPGIYLAAVALGVIGCLPASMSSVSAPEATAVPVTVPGPAPSLRPVLLNAVPARPGDRVVALTFDDGPDPVWTPRVLAVLRKHGAVATFCMIGSHVTGHEDVVRAVAAAGMRLCDHTRTHDEHLSTRPLPQIVAEIVTARDAIWAATDVQVSYFRAPGGFWSPDLQRVAEDNKLQPLGWSVDPRDWHRPGVAAIVAAVKRQVHPGAVVLLHDGGGVRDQTIAALDQLLPWLAAQGYRFGFPTP